MTCVLDTEDEGLLGPAKHANDEHLMTQSPRPTEANYTNAAGPRSIHGPDPYQRGAIHQSFVRVLRRPSTKITAVSPQPA
jgi:hypothetical protein